MSGTEEPYIFLRKENGSEENDEWDDSSLVAAYDKQVASVKRRITRKIQKELGLKDEDVQEFLTGSDAEHSSSKSNKKGKRKKKRKWAVGSSCRAIYSEDGEEYEAVIVKVMDSHWCVVRYVGYDNEEEVLMEDLMPSLGKAVVQLQIEASNKEAQENASKEVDCEDEVPREEISSGKIPSHKSHTSTFEPMTDRLPMSFPIPPLPPVPPGRMPKRLIKKQEDINSLLMSWYMCGYYTGLYERGQQFEN